METTQEDRDTFRVALNSAFFLDLPATRALLNDADRLAAIERQVLWRTEDMPEDATGWMRGREWGKFKQAWTSTEYPYVIPCEFDYRPDEPGPIWLPILDPPEGDQQFPASPSA